MIKKNSPFKFTKGILTMKKLCLLLLALLLAVAVFAACDEVESPDASDMTDAEATTAVATTFNETETDQPVDGTETVDPDTGLTEPETTTCVHVPGDWIVDAYSTCLTDGVRHKVCTICGEIVADKTIPTRGHRETDWILDTPARIGVSGSKHTECTRCKEIVRTESIPALIPSEGLLFTSNGDGTCFVSGIGTCTDNHVVIPLTSPEGDIVTSIGYDAFSDCIVFTSIVIPDSVTSIDAKAFNNCTHLMNIEIPNSVTTIGFFAFRSCYSLKSIELPNSVTTLADCAFYQCWRLSSIEIPDSVTIIRDSMFVGCLELKNVVIPDSVISIEKGAFRYCSGLTDVYYTGTEEQWAAISIETDNYCLTDATIHYNYVPQE